MAISKQQRAAVVAILVAGLLGGAAILFTGKGGGSGEAGHEHGEHAEQGEHADHGDGHAHDQPASSPASAPAAAAAAAAPAQAADQPHVIRLTPEQVQQAGIGIATAGPAPLRGSVDFPGEIRFNDDRTAHVVPRVAGVAQAVPANLGEQVAKGQVLAVIASTALAEQRSELLAAQRREALARATYAREKTLWQEKISAEQDYQQARTALEEAQIAVQNARQKLVAIGASESAAQDGKGGSLNQFALRAPFDGIIVEKHLSLGEAVKEDASVFTISDLSSVWAEFVVSARDLDQVRVGETVRIRSTASETQAEGKVSYVGALLGEQTRTAKARVTLANPGMAWRPGLFVTVSVLGAAAQVPVTVEADAVQQVDGRSAVFVAVPGGFAVQPVKTGRSGGKLVEITEGLQAGARYAAANSFILKSELGKASAGHEH